MKRRVVITGIGIISPIGLKKETFWGSLIKGRSGIKRISLFDPSTYRSQIAGEIRDFDPLKYLDKKEVRDMDRVSHLAVAAAADAIEDAGIKPNEDTGVIIGTGLGGITSADIQYTIYASKGPRYVSPLTIPMSMYNATACYISKRYGLMGPGYTITTACTSGTNAIGEAYRLIKHGYADVMVSGGTEATISPGIFTAWCALRILSKRNDEPEQSCRPFSKDRDGMVLGEGAGIVILEELEHALKKSASIYAEVVGYGSSYDADHLTAPTVMGQVKAMRAALRDADMPTERIDYINAHGTATTLNDRVETESIKKVFGERAYSISVSSIKSMIGHTLGAAGTIETIACCLSIKNNVIPPTINYTEFDPECDLDYVPNKAREAALDTVMSNSFGFGGSNGVLIIRRYG